MRPVWVTSPPPDRTETNSLSAWPPAAPSSTSSAAARVTWPLAAVIVPLLVTERAIITTPPWRETISPALTIAPPDSPFTLSGPPAMNASMFISRVEATKLPPEITRPPAPTITPLGFIR